MKQLLSVAVLFLVCAAGKAAPILVHSDSGSIVTNWAAFVTPTANNGTSGSGTIAFALGTGEVTNINGASVAPAAAFLSTFTVPETWTATTVGSVTTYTFTFGPATNTQAGQAGDPPFKVIQFFPSDAFSIFTVDYRTATIASNTPDTVTLTDTEQLASQFGGGIIDPDGLGNTYNFSAFANPASTFDLTLNSTANILTEFLNGGLIVGVGTTSAPSGSFTQTAIPEPTTLSALAVGLMGLAIYRRRRRA